MDSELNLDANSRRLGFEQPRTSTIFPVPPNRRHGSELSRTSTIFVPANHRHGFELSRTSTSSHRESTDTNRLKKWWRINMVRVFWYMVLRLLGFYTLIRPIISQIMINTRNPVYMLTSRQCPRICGNADTYGIGIRIATYLQMLLITSVNRLSPSILVLLTPRICGWFLHFLLPSPPWLSERQLSSMPRSLSCLVAEW